MRTFFAAAATMALLTGCAKHPDNITAARIDALPYQSMDCAALRSKLASTEKTLADEVSDQKVAWAIDMALPVVAGAGNRETQVATLRGERLTIRETLVAKKCP